MQLLFYLKLYPCRHAISLLYLLYLIQPIIKGYVDILMLLTIANANYRNCLIKQNVHCKKSGKQRYPSDGAVSNG